MQSEDLTLDSAYKKSHQPMPLTSEFAANNVDPPHFVIRTLLLLLLPNAGILLCDGGQDPSRLTAIQSAVATLERIHRCFSISNQVSSCI
jgi:hypothetical protein